MLERARQGLSAARPFVRLKAAQRCQAHARQVGDKARVEVLGKEIVQHLIALASDPACAGEHQRSYVSMAASQAPGPPRWFIDELAKTSPPEWLRMVLDAQCHITEGWDARGRKTADQVTPAGWRDFERHLREADKLLRAAYALEPGFPEAATGMIAVATGLDQPAKEVRALFDRAIAAHYDHHPAYRDFLWFSLPRWADHTRVCSAWGRRVSMLLG